MKAIINRKIYDTEKSILIGKMEQNGGENFNFVVEELYKTRKGNYFIYGDGGAMTSYSSGAKFWTIEKNEILDWLEENRNYIYDDDIEAIIKELGGEIEEG